LKTNFFEISCRVSKEAQFCADLGKVQNSCVKQTGKIITEKLFVALRENLAK
jgi:hypothetical protein